MRRDPILLAATLLFTAIFVASAAADTWPRFRGPNGEGQGQADDVPSTFTEADFAWKIPLPGVGHSSPVVWNERVFVTSANPDTAELVVQCFNIKTGDEMWQRRYPATPYAKHATNSFATSTPALDAEQMYFAWRDGDAIRMASLTHDGRDAWAPRDIGRLKEDHGFGASPIVVGDIVCITHDTVEEGDSYIIGLDRHTGEEEWRTPCGKGKTSFATPFLWQSPEGETLMLMTTMSSGLTAYVPATGAVKWNAFTSDLTDRCVSSPIVANGVVLMTCGAGNNGKLLIGAKLGGAADVPKEAYRLTQSIPNLPTPVVADDAVFLMQDRGILTCMDPANGEAFWRKRIGSAAGGNFHSSPLHVGNRIFVISLEGEVVVLAASKEYELIARNSLNEPVTATPAIAEGKLLIRTEKSLICLGGKR